MLALFIILALSLAFGLAWISTGRSGFNGWMAYLVAMLIGAGIIMAGWHLIRAESPPRWLAYLTIGAALLHLAAGVLWYVALPVWGHESRAEQLGYVMSDASKRDQAAWKLAGSNKSLLDAFRNNRATDQYGGMLFLSAFAYRYMGGTNHQPLLIVVITASFSSIAILFTWAFAFRVWGLQVAKLSAIALAVFPDAVLLGSSQMREAFTISLSSAAFYGLFRYYGNRTWKNLLWLIIPLALFLPFSPPFAALLFVMLGLSALALSKDTNLVKRSRWFWVVVIGMVLLILVGLWLALSQFTPERISNPIEMISWWLRKSAEYQAHLTKLASGWLQKTFKSTPEWLHMPILVGYGTVQPFLPAAITVGSHAPIWPRIVLWRSVGWTILLGFLIYAPILAFRKKEISTFTRVFCLVVWLGIFIAAFRGGGDMWDNPRYRTTFAGLQIALAAWAWVEHRRISDPWLHRALLGLGAIMIWFLPWYLRRYIGFNWPVSSLTLTLILGTCSAILIIFLDWLWERLKKRRQPPSSETHLE
ncbi:MAG: hypothetical protein A2Z16_08710 [Chloroflexi bacterium RBG_16_54_18]|nr:MAG: hypothetical protein A2Z16_08710 [Chloroflexi bacterium RBG_16_54_18]